MNAAFPVQISAGDCAQKTKKEVFFLHRILRIDHTHIRAYSHITSNEIPAVGLSLLGKAANL
jgi:hypothetical protein